MLNIAIEKVRALKGHFEYVRYQYDLAENDFKAAEKQLNGALLVENCEGKPVPSATIERYDRTSERFNQMAEAKTRAYQAWAEAFRESVEPEALIAATF